MVIKNNALGRILKQRRLMLDLTLRELRKKSGVSAPHLGRIERGERFPSGRILRKIAEPLEFNENELFVMAGYLSPKTSTGSRQEMADTTGRIDPYVAMVLGKEPVEVQRNVIAILILLKNIAKGIT